MIRRAQKKDLEAIDRLLYQVLAIHEEIRPDIFIAGTKKYTDEELMSIFENEQTPVFVYTDDKDEVLGYCFCQMQQVKGIANMHDRKTLYIDDLCVDGAARGQHVGKQLYDYVIQYARQQGCDNVTLHVWQGNDGARAFYEAMGFGIQKSLMEKVL
ncbi:MAG: GNAT family N-acetyltransferase [Faecalicoccus sp.]|nr:GNAT family N-acetyltransferase [Faecalicoccus sp.]